MIHIRDWRTSSFSGGENNECVAVANTLTAVRDSKNPHGGMVHVSLSQLIAGIKHDRFRR